MKKFAITIILSLFGSIAQAQSDPCPNMSFCYVYVCPDANGQCHWEYHCSKDPNNEYKPCTPQRWPDNSTLHYSTNNLSQQCVDAAALDACIDNAFCMWMRLCGSDGTLYAERDPWDPTDFNQIPIEVQPNNGQFSASTHEFGDTKQQISQTIAVTKVQKYCNGALFAANPSFPQNQPLQWATFIDINATSDYNAASTDVYPCPGTNCNTKLPKNDLCIALTHEIGHLLGLMHTQPSPYEANPTDGSQPMPDCGSHDPSGKDLMSPYLNQGCTGNPPQMTDYDKCMYKKLYCPQDQGIGKGGASPLTTSCDNSAVEGAPSYDPKLAAFPNPSTGNVTVQYDTRKAESIDFRIFNSLGEQIYAAIFRESSGLATHEINLSKWPSGNYIIRIAGTDIRSSRLINIMR